MISAPICQGQSRLRVGNAGDCSALSGTADPVEFLTDEGPSSKGPAMSDPENSNFGALEHEERNAEGSEETDLFSTDTIEIESLTDSTETIDLKAVVRELEAWRSSKTVDVASTSIGELLQILPVPALLIDSSYRIVFANRSWSKVSSDYEKLQGRAFFSLFSKASAAEKVKSLMEKLFETKKAQFGGAVLEIEKSRIWGRVYLRSVTAGDDRLLLVLVQDVTAEKKQIIFTERHKKELLTARDQLEDHVRERTLELRKTNEQLLEEIENRKRVERRLEASRAGFTSIVEKTEEGMVVLDPSGRVLYANPAAATLLGRPQEKLFGARIGKRPESGTATEVKGFRSNGEPGILEIRMEQTDWHGKPAYLATLQDITDRKLAEQELLKAQKLESLELIAGGIAHDFNNLLTGTLANISLAKMHASRGTPVYEALRNAEKSASAAGYLTQQLMTFTKPEVEPVIRLTSVSEVLQQTTNLARSGSNLKYEMSLADNLWAIKADPHQIGQVFQNLLINAQQAMPEGGMVNLSAANRVVGADGDKTVPALGEGNYVRISVEDDGPGIPQETLSKIFDPYFTTKPGGSGLGLSMAYSIVRRHGGNIEVQSEVDHGTAFFIYLPASGRTLEISPEESGEIPSLGTARILLMDDEELISDVASDLLGVLGYEVVCARDGAEAIEMYKRAKESQDPFSVVIMDLTVPGGMGGKAAIEKLLEIDPDVKAIVSSGYSTDAVLSDYKRYGFKGIVPKPYNVQDLSRALYEVLLDGREENSRG